MYLEYYKKQLNYDEMPTFLKKYLLCPTLARLQKVGYFCGMDYASSAIYRFREYISRYDHSLTVALLTYKLTKNKLYTIAALFHDVATPCFSHVIDYMNEDYEEQESTEKYTEEIIQSDLYLKKCLEEDHLDVLEIVDFKKYHIVDSKRPSLCADRLDGIILTGIGWTKNITKKEISDIIKNTTIFKNESDEWEIGFTSSIIAQKVLLINESIDQMCHSYEDNYMMLLLAKITKLAIENNYLKYHDLFQYNEEEIFDLFDKIPDVSFQKLLQEFKTIKEEDIPHDDIPKIKKRCINPLVNGKRTI